MSAPVSSSQDMNSIIAHNLRSLRSSAGISLGELSKLTGVSKSMLGQIERGESSPTISTLWKIATGLKVSFTDLMEHQDPEVQILSEADMEPVLSDDGRFSLYPLIPSRSGQKTEVMDLILSKDARSDSSPHAAGTEEYLIVYEGTLTLELQGTEPVQYDVSAGSMIHFNADVPHSYRNTHEAAVRAVNVIYYSGSTV